MPVYDIYEPSLTVPLGKTFWHPVVVPSPEQRERELAEMSRKFREDFARFISGRVPALRPEEV